MTDTPQEQQPPQAIVRPIGKIKKAPSFFQNPIVQDIIGGLLVPLIKGSILSIVERVLYGEQGGPGPSTTLGSGRVSYQKHFGQDLKFSGVAQRERFQQYQQVRSQFPQLEDMVFRNEYDATLVVNALYDRIEQYSYATVGDLYEIVGLQVPDYTYVQFGWNMVQLARYELRNLPSGGVQLVMPRPFPLQN
jgi:hypothetical protein